MLEAMARIAPSQPNEAMARIAPRRNGNISLDPSCRVKIPKQGSLNQYTCLLSLEFGVQMNTASKLGPHTHTNRKTCPGDCGVLS